MRLVLASGSPRRAELLRAAGFDFDIVVADVDESIRIGEPPAAYVRRLAAEKSAAAQNGTVKSAPRVPEVASRVIGPDERVFLGADTTVVVDGEILGKPTDDADAAAMIRRLSGKRHQVLTGISLRHGAFEVGRVDTTAVQFAQLADDDVAWYVASGEGRDKAGAYAIQGLASRFVSGIEGSYSNVVGLPISSVYELLTLVTPPRGFTPRRESSGGRAAD
jgi:septum formation protein